MLTIKSYNVGQRRLFVCKMPSPHKPQARCGVVMRQRAADHHGMKTTHSNEVLAVQP